MSLLADVVEHLEAEEVSFAVVGASAMAMYGHTRFTADVDLLTTHPGPLESSFWRAFDAQGDGVEVRVGDSSDPLRGVTSLYRGSEAIDVVVGKHGWQSRAVQRAVPLPGLDEGSRLTPVLSLPDLMVTKLFAGGRDDLRDVQDLIDAQHEDEWELLKSAVNEVFDAEPGLPKSTRVLWQDGDWFRGAGEK